MPTNHELTIRGRIAARVFLVFPKILQHPACMDHAILHGKPFSNSLNDVQNHASTC